jgi:hypothetical protein
VHEGPRGMGVCENLPSVCKQLSDRCRVFSRTLPCSRNGQTLGFQNYQLLNDPDWPANFPIGVL